MDYKDAAIPWDPASMSATHCRDSLSSGCRSRAGLAACDSFSFMQESMNYESRRAVDHGGFLVPFFRVGDHHGVNVDVLEPGT